MVKKFSFTLILFFSLSLGANEIDEFKKGKELFKRKCSSCHIEYIDANRIKENFFEEDNALKLKAPTVNMINWAINRGPKRIGEDDLEFKLDEVTDFLIDYLSQPDKKKSICDKKVLSYLPKKRPLTKKDKISKEDIKAIAKYLIEFKAPSKNRVIYKEESRVQDIIKEAKKDNRYILIEVSSKLCHYCKEMKKDVISTEKFQRFLKDNYLFKEIVVEKESLPYSLAKEYKGITPTFFILNSDGELVDYLIGSFKLNEFIDKLKKIKEKS